MSDVVVESVNPNTPVTSNLTKDGTIEANATSGPLSFDELEEVTMKAKRAKAEKKDKPEPKVEAKQEKSKDLTSDTDKGKVPQPKEPKETAGKKASTEEESDAPTMAQARKMIKAKFQDSEIDLDEEALVPVKINGKEEMVQVKDLMTNYSGKTAWDKKFSELDQTRKQTQGQQQKVQEITNMIQQVYEEQDPELRIMKIAKLAGIDEMQFRQKFYQDNVQWLEKYYTMSDDERRAEDLAYEAKVHKHRADTLEKSIRDQEDFKSLNGKVENLRASHNVTEREFVEKYDQLETLVKLGRISPQQVTPETIVQAITNDRYVGAALNKIDTLGLQWNEQTKNQNITKAVTSAIQHGLSIEEMIEGMDEAWGIKKAQRKIEEKKRENQEFLTGKKPVSQPKPQGSDVWSFDQI